MKTFKVIRFYRDSNLTETIATGLTLDDAQEHCRDPETSWHTATSPEARARTEKYGPWFDGYDEEE